MVKLVFSTLNRLLVMKMDKKPYYCHICGRLLGYTSVSWILKIEHTCEQCKEKYKNNTFLTDFIGEEKDV